ncbi:MAG: DUF389 domain-containing protein [Bacteroidota bacterium]|nr:DUF389 domain-containing protein [Bacteroidota bacterium]
MLLEKLLEFFNLKGELEDFNKTHDQIEKDIVFKGTNLWILIFAILVASVGLNTNSTAVIIGAMLISPLMGPIIGMGYSVATYNFSMLRKAIKNFAFAVGASILTSTIYFFISPVSTAHSELLARTSPTIYDVLIAFFGGLACIVAISSRQKGNVIAGAAIATALMPPLCTAGYGLATGQFNYFFGAFYLFTINTVFIALGSVIVCQLAKFPILTLISTRRKKQVNQIISLVIVITLLPSIYFGYLLVQKEKFNENATRFVKRVNIFEGNYLLKSDVNSKDFSIHLVFGGNDLNESHKRHIKQIAKDFNLSNSKIIIEQGLSTINDMNDNEIMKEVELNQLKMKLQMVQKNMDSLEKSKLLGQQLLKEIKPLYSEINSVIYSETYEFDSIQQMPLSLLIIKGDLIKEEDKKHIKQWLKARLNKNYVKILYVE